MIYLQNKLSLNKKISIDNSFIQITIYFLFFFVMQGKEKKQRLGKKKDRLNSEEGDQH